MQNFHILKYGWQTKTTDHLKFGDKYGKNISYTATKTEMDASKTASKIVV